MGIIPFIFFIILVTSRTKPDNRHADLFKTFIILSLIMGGLSALFLNPLGLAAVIGIVVYLSKKAKEDKEAKKRSEKYGWDPHRWDKEKGNTNTYQQQRQFNQQQRANNQQPYNNAHNQASNSYANNAVHFDPLPKSMAKRKKIISTFNEKYNLCLTPEQIQSIANSSYMSQIWNREVQSMNQKYNVVYEWFPGYTQWLRVYMYVFHVQEITSDIRQQESIAMYAFEEIFRYSDSLPNMPISEKISRINQEFFTSFDDATFMIAYRFLESKGLKHNLTGPDLVKDEDEVDELLKKYHPGSSTGAQ